MPIVTLIKETCEDLINLYKKQKGDPFQRINTSLIFPRYRNTEQQSASENTEQENTASDLRVSEQEARFCFAAAVERGKEYRYSVETPTLLPYQFTGMTGISAQTDLTLWSLDEEEKVYNIEFKAKNPVQKSIDKDIRKLVGEVPPGIWFHLFEKADNETFPALARKFGNAFLQYGQDKSNGFLFAICALENEVGILGTLASYSKTQTDLRVFFKEGCELLEAPSKKNVGRWVVL